MSAYCFCDYETPEFYDRRQHAARMPHKCSECGKRIAPGESYERAIGKWDGDVGVFKTCCRCVALRECIKAHVPCFCWAHGNLLEDCRSEVDNLPAEAYGTGLLFELGRLAVAIRRAPKFKSAEGAREVER